MSIVSTSMFHVLSVIYLFVPLISEATFLQNLTTDQRPVSLEDNHLLIKTRCTTQHLSGSSSFSDFASKEGLIFLQIYKKKFNYKEELFRKKMTYTTNVCRQWNLPRQGFDRRMSMYVCLCVCVCVYRAWIHCPYLCRHSDHKAYILI